jgi:hypothetical protein
MMVLQQRNPQKAVGAAASTWPWSQTPIIRYF